MLSAQDWTAALTLQIWQVAETFQSHPNLAPVGGAPLNNAARVMDSECMLRSYKDLRLCEAAYCSAISGIRPTRPRAGRYP